MNITEYEDYMELMEENARLKHIANEKDITIRLLSKRCRELGDNPIPIEALDETLTCSRCANYGIIKVFATEEGHIASSGCVCQTNAALKARLATAEKVVEAAKQWRSSYGFTGAISIRMTANIRLEQALAAYEEEVAE